MLKLFSGVYNALRGSVFPCSNGSIYTHNDFSVSNARVLPQADTSVIWQEWRNSLRPLSLLHAQQ